MGDVDDVVVELVESVNRTMSRHGWRAAYVEGAQMVVAMQRRRDGSRVRVAIDAGIAALSHDPVKYVLVELWSTDGWRDP